MLRKSGTDYGSLYMGRYKRPAEPVFAGAVFVLILTEATGAGAQWMSVLEFLAYIRSSGQSSACTRATSKRAGVKTRRSCVFASRLTDTLRIKLFPLPWLPAGRPRSARQGQTSTFAARMQPPVHQKT